MNRTFADIYGVYDVANDVGWVSVGIDFDTAAFAAYYIDKKWMDAVTYIILILFLIWKPFGFSGKRLKKVDI